MSALLALLLTTAAAAGQLSFSTVYDESRRIRVEGPVARVEWANPRAYVFVHARDTTGVMTNWAVDVGSAADLERAGVPRDVVRAGDIVVVEGHPAHGTDNRVFARSVVLKRTGARLFTPAAARPAPAKRPVPRWPGGQPRLGPAPGEKGYWGPAGGRLLVERGVKVSVNDDGLLLNLDEADRVAPFQPWSRALFLYRQRTRLQDDPLGRCLPPGGPRQFTMPNGFQFVEQRELGRILVLHGGGNRNWRVIYTDGRPAGQSAEAVPSYYGYSVGRWEKDTLVVDSVGFNERFWLSAGGLPHTDALRLVERFTRTDLNTLLYEVTVDDPRTYTRPWSGGWSVQWVADRDIEEYFCEDSVPGSAIP